MAKFELRFFDLFGYGQHIKCNYDCQVDSEFNEHWVKITIHDNGSDRDIYLDKSTAIKFSKTLRTEINKITESDVMSFKEGDFTTATGTPKK